MYLDCSTNSLFLFLECSQGYYGLNCRQSCNQCAGRCDVIDGTCPDGCRLWWIGDKCDTEISKFVTLTNACRGESIAKLLHSNSKLCYFCLCTECVQRKKTRIFLCPVIVIIV